MREIQSTSTLRPWGSFNDNRNHFLQMSLLTRTTRIFTWPASAYILAATRYKPKPKQYSFPDDWPRSSKAFAALETLWDASFVTNIAYERMRYLTIEIYYAFQDMTTGKKDCLNTHSQWAYGGRFIELEQAIGMIVVPKWCFDWLTLILSRNIIHRYSWRSMYIVILVVVSPGIRAAQVPGSVVELYILKAVLRINNNACLSLGRPRKDLESIIITFCWTKGDRMTNAILLQGIYFLVRFHLTFGRDNSVDVRHNYPNSTLVPLRVAENV